MHSTLRVCVPPLQRAEHVPQADAFQKYDTEGQAGSVQGSIVAINTHRTVSALYYEQLEE